MIHTVIFDLDGLLADTETNWYRVCKELMGNYGREFTLDAYVRDHSGKTIVDNANLYIKNYELPLTTEECVEWLVSTEMRYVEQGVPMMEGAMELLQYLKENGYKVILGTSSKLDRALTILKGNQADVFFDDFVVGYDVERSKPFPDIFLKAAEKAGSKPEECLVLEDSESGIQAAYAAGIPVICIPDLKRPSGGYEAKTTAMMESLHDVIDYLKGDRKSED